jgi:transposase
MKNYIGIDISKSSIDVYDGKKSYKFENNESGFKEIIALVENIKETVFIFEPTGIYSYDLTEFCDKNSIGCVIVSPKVSRDFARSLKVRSKTDKIDAKVLYKYQSHVESNMVKIPKINHHAIQIQEMLNSYELVKSTIQQHKNQLESISKNNKYLVRSTTRMIKFNETEADKLFAKIEKLLFKDESIKRKYEAMLTIPAIKNKSALYLISFFLKYPLANAKEMTALVGLDPVMRDSGTYRGKQRISKHGGQQLRNLLFLPTLCSLRFNDRIKVFYTRLTSNAKSKKLAVIASMRKLILMAFSIFKSEQNYQPLYVEN